MNKNNLTQIIVKNIPKNWSIYQDENKMCYIFYIDELINTEKPYKTVNGAYNQILTLEDAKIKQEKAIKRQAHLERVKALSDFDNEINKYIQSNQEVNSYKRSIAIATKNMNYLKVVMLKDELHNLTLKLKEKYLKDFGTQEEDLDNFLKKTSEGNAAKCKLYLHAITILADILESISLDIESIISSIDPQADFGFFKDIREISKAAALKINFMSKNTSMEYQIKFADYSEELQEQFLINIINFFKYLDSEV